MIQLSDEQRTQWAIDGYLHLKGVIDPDEVKFLSAELDRIRAVPGYEPAPGDLPRGHYKWSPGALDQDVEGFMDRRDLLSYGKPFIDLVDRPHVFDLIVDIMGPYLLHSMSQAIVRAKEHIFPCPECFFFTEREEQPCDICRDVRRDRQFICLVEEASHVLYLEKDGLLRGTYHVLGGLISPMDGIGPEMLQVSSLVQRVAADEIKEVILALTPSVEGDTTSLYLARLLKPFTEVSRIAYGLPVGSELEYADDVTLSRALEGRRAVE